ncbi:MAG: hypothetical protein GEV07_23580 [Streptosporangiales bacterium]|nr:hypothetical protein [Streptosporangiales bacterium]
MSRHHGRPDRFLRNARKGPRRPSSVARPGRVAVALAAAALVLLGGCDAGGRSPDSTSRSATLPSASGTLSGRSVSEHGPVTRLRDLLTNRADALLDGDRAGFLAALDDSATDLVEDEGTFYDNLRGAAPATWAYSVDGRSARREPSKGGDRWAYTVYISYSLTGFATERAVSRQQVEVVERTEGWRITSISEGDEHTEPWELGKTTSVRGDRIVVVGVDTPKAKLRRIHRRAVDAVPRVDGVWDGNWARGAVVVVPPDVSGAARLAQTDNIEALAAVATGASMIDGSGDLRRWDRVVVNPKAWQRMNDTGRDVVLAHELTHVATGSLGTVPLWVSEGFADYVGWKNQDVAMSSIAPELAADVRRGEAPGNLPTDDDFRGGEPDQAYEEAWFAAKYVVFRYGEGKLLALYRAMASRSGTSVADQDAVLRSTLGVSRSEFRHGWRAYVKSRLG